MAQDIVIKVTVDDKDVETTTDALKRMGKTDDENAKKFADNSKKFQKNQQENQDSLGKLTGSMKKVGLAIAAAFTVQKLIEFSKEIIKVTGQFEKLEAVLTNTLGSKSEAQKSLTMIQDFAAKTPFSVLELTQAFVKLVNQGFKPTQKEMIALGDLASSTGKSFDQLAEAIIDAQVGEFERLKEFGIRARKEGDNVTFTFKGVKTQVDNTEESIRQYLTSLGDAQGVSGAMSSISETLEGKISNLGDSWDAFLLSLGNSETPFGKAVSGLIAMASSALQTATAFFKTEEAQTRLTKIGEVYNERLEEEKVNLKALFEELKAENTPRGVKEKNINTINKLYGDYLPKLLTEKSSIEEISRAQEIANEKMKTSVGLRILQNQLIESGERFTQRETELIDALSLATGKSTAEIVKFAEAYKVQTSATEELTLATEEETKAFVDQKDAVTDGMPDFIEYKGEMISTANVLTELSNINKDRIVDSWELNDIIAQLTVTEETHADKITKSKDAITLLNEEIKKLSNEMLLQALSGDVSVDTLEKFRNATNRLKSAQQEVQEAIAQSRMQLLKTVEEDGLMEMPEIDSEPLIQYWDATEKKFTYITQTEADKRTKLRETEIQGQIDAFSSTAALFDAMGSLYEKGSAEQKAFTLFGIAMNTASAIASLVAVSQANPLNSVTFGAAGVAQYIAGFAQIIANMAAAKQAIAGFKDGVIMLQGEGTETSDSIPAFLSKNESVIKAKQSKKYSGLLRAINDDELDKYIAYNWHNLPVPKERINKKDNAFIEALTNNLGSKGFSEDGIIETLKKMDKNENKRTQLLAEAILSQKNKYVNLRR